MTEAQLQSKCVIWLRNTYPQTHGLFFAVNNNSIHAHAGGTMKALGVIPGVADTVFLWDGKAYFLEFKTPDGRQSKAQREWQDKINANGFNYFIVREFVQFQELIMQIMDWHL